MDGQVQTNQTASNGQINVSVPAGSHHVALQWVNVVPTPQPTVTESPSLSPTPTATTKGKQVIVGSFDKNRGQNRFEVLDSNGTSLSGSVEILQGVSTEGQIRTTDLNGDGTQEVLALGYRPTEGVVLEYWNGKGQLLHSYDVFTTEFNSENYLLTTPEAQSNPAEAIVIGRDQQGAYHLVNLDLGGMKKGTTQILEPGYSRLEGILSVDTTGTGVADLAILGRNQNNSVELNVIKDQVVTSSVLIYGNGYTGEAYTFSLDLNGDGTEEIGTVCRNSISDSFRFLVLSGEGQVLLKRNLFPGKFESEASFSAADIDADGRDEVVAVGRMIGTGSNVIQVIDDDGTQLMARSVLDPSFKTGNASVLADLNGDGQPEFVVAGKDSVSGVAAYQVLEKGGALLGGGIAFETPASPFLASTDLDQDGQDELMIMGEFEDGAFGLELRKGENGQVQFSTTFSTAPSFFDAGNLM
jgi:hypothetical protein